MRSDQTRHTCCRYTDHYTIYGDCPVNQFDWFQVCLQLHLHHFQIPPVYLTTERSLYDQSCHLPDFLAPTSCQGTFHRSLLFQSCVRLVSLNFLFWVLTLWLLKKLQDLVYTAVVIYYCVALCIRCNVIFDICPARASYSPCYQATVKHPWSRFLIIVSQLNKLHSSLRLTSYIWSTT